MGFFSSSSVLNLNRKGFDCTIDVCVLNFYFPFRSFTLFNMNRNENPRNMFGILLIFREKHSKREFLCVHVLKIKRLTQHSYIIDEAFWRTA